MNYFDELTRTMTWLGHKEKTYFIGQAVGFSGTAMYGTLKEVAEEKRLELPVIEETQMGMSLGLALEGFLPISIYPRLNFLLCGISGLVNHLDKYSLMSDYKPHVIIRSSIGSVNPLDPQLQHKGDFTDAIQSMCKSVKVTRLERTEDIFNTYADAYYNKGVHLICEVADFLNQDFYDNYNKFRESYNGR